MRKQEMGKFEIEWRKLFNGAELSPPESVWHAIDSKLWLSENSGFENGWKNRFQHAELTPSENVWKAIDVSLVQSENDGMKKRIVYWQRLAAASIGILIMFGSYSWFSNTTDSPEQLVNNHEPSLEKNSTSETANQNSSQALSTNEVGNPEQSDNSNQTVASSTRSEKPSNESAEAYKQGISNSGTNTITNTNEIANKISIEESRRDSQQAIVQNKNRRSTFQFNQGPIAELTFVDVSKLPNFFGPNDYAIAYRLADARPAVMAKKKNTAVNENKWAAVSFSAGTFSPGIGNTEIIESNRAVTNNISFDGLQSSSTPATKSENVKPGTSIAMAISAGKRIFKKFILHGGVSYLNQTSASNSEVVSVAPANKVYGVASYSLESTNSVTYQSQQEINSTFQFISVPVQLGYMLVDRKFGIQVNGGLSPDFFLKNSVYNETTQVETTNSAGEDGTFNTVSLSGLGSIEFSYKFLNHYRLSLAPGVKYSLTSIYNENTTASAKPFVADIGLRFRYIF